MLGPLHGVAFLVYLVLVLQIRNGQDWGFWRTIAVLLASALLFGRLWAGRDLAGPQAAERVARC